MTMIGIGLVLVFGFLTWRNLSNGRWFWGLATAIGVLVGLGSLWVDYMRATGGTNGSPPSAQAPSSQAAPVIGDYKPPAADSAAPEQTTTDRLE